MSQQVNLPDEHITVLLNEAVDALVTDPDGVYVDGTFGRGGHSRKVLERLSPKGRLFGFDKDPAAVAAGERLAAEDARFRMVYSAYVDMNVALSAQGIGDVSGVLLDLGVSSPQLDDAERGFSFLNDGPLDMRMDTARGMTAAEWVNSVPEEEIVRVLKDYGEERFARRMARAIVAERTISPISTTGRLAKIVAEANPAWEKGKHPATRAFQAIRIEINRELADLEPALESAASLLARGGRLVVISFHSLEDRIVKRFMRSRERGPKIPREIPVLENALRTEFRVQGKAVKPSAQEIQNNPRSRSAIMRVLERIERRAEK